jgi:energy-coupling factor transporter ATP-binding protein EcfA2
VDGYYGAMAFEDMFKLNQGEILQYMRFHYADFTTYDCVNLGENQTAIIGKNGSGKTTHLKEMARSLLPDMQIKGIKGTDKLWSGGFVFQPTDKRDGINPITIDGKGYMSSDYVRFDSGFAVDGKTCNDYLAQDAVLPDRTVMARKLREGEISWEPKWDAGLESELSHQNLFLKITHHWPEYAFYDALNKPYKESDLVLRIIKTNEDTPNALRLRSELINFMNRFGVNHAEPLRRKYVDPNTGETKELTTNADLGEFIELAYYGDYEVEKISESEYKKTVFAPPIFENPLATPFLFGMNFLNEQHTIPDLAKDIADNMPSTLIEWPRKGFQGPRKYIFSAIADVHLGDGAFKNDLERLDAAISAHFVQKFKVDEYEHESWVEERNKIIKNASEILKSWEVVPTWKTTYAYGDEKSTSHHGYEINFFENNISYMDYYANYPNETTRRWMLRALQVASILSESATPTPYKIAIWDEPELGLHPTAIENVKHKVFPYLAEHGIKLVFSTHSLVLASAAQKIHKAEWLDQENRSSYPVLKELPFIPEDSLTEIGFTKSDLLASIKTLLIVEGKHDKIVLETYFGEEFLGKERIRISTLDGANNLMLMPEAEIIMDFLASKVVILTDGGHKSRLGGANDKTLAELNRYLSLNESSSALMVLNQLRSKVVNQSEGDKLLSLIDSILLRSKHDDKLLSRFAIYLLGQDDIIHYLNPQLVLAPYVGLKDWSALIAEWKKHKADEKTRNVPFRDRMNEKTFYKKILGAKLSTSNVKNAADALLDVGPIPEFEHLRTVLQGSVENNPGA